MGPCFWSILKKPAISLVFWAAAPIRDEVLLNGEIFRTFVRLSVHPSPPQGQPARPEAQPARPEAQPARPKVQLVRPEAQLAKPETQLAMPEAEPARPGAQTARSEAQTASQPGLRLQGWLTFP